MNSDISKITGYFNLALVALFILLVIGVVIAALRGLRRGVWKSTHNMIFMLSLIIIAFVTLDPLCKFIENLNISKFYTGTLILSRTVNGEQLVYAVPLTTVKETASEFLQGIYLLFNVSSSASSATNFAFAIVESFLKIILFMVEMILILTLGNLLSFIT